MRRPAPGRHAELRHEIAKLPAHRPRADIAKLRNFSGFFVNARGVSCSTRILFHLVPRFGRISDGHAAGKRKSEIYSAKRSSRKRHSLTQHEAQWFLRLVKIAPTSRHPSGPKTLSSKPAAHSCYQPESPISSGKHATSAA